MVSQQLGKHQTTLGLRANNPADLLLATRDGHRDLHAVLALVRAQTPAPLGAFVRLLRAASATADPAFFMQAALLGFPGQHGLGGNAELFLPDTHGEDGAGADHAVDDFY
ncbi:hypothetical protein ACFSC4_15690 [Deinococcus malanensis]|uniref:hypothetical protein n=1 Tax=Deinococcus malanensis TaxID=1706855 RepID=UPI00362EC749